MRQPTAVIAALVAALLVAASHAALAASPAPRQRAQPAKARPAPPAPTLPDASPEQLEAAALAYFGDYACEFNEVVKVSLNPRFQGYIDVLHRKSQWIMKPVLSRTGALRLEDVKGRMLMLQIANKSMLMDTKIGQRMVDNCIHPEQAKFNASRT